MYNDPPLFNTNFLRWVNTTYLKMQQLFRFQEQLLPHFVFRMTWNLMLLMDGKFKMEEQCGEVA